MNSNHSNLFCKKKSYVPINLFQFNKMFFFPSFCLNINLGIYFLKEKKQIQIIKKNLFELKFLVINDLLFPSGLIFINIIFVRIKIDHINYTKPQWKNEISFSNYPFVECSDEMQRCNKRGGFIFNKLQKKVELSTLSDY